MISYFIETALIWFAFYLLYHFFFRRATFFRSNRIFLISSLAMGLILPLLNLKLHQRQNEILVYISDQINLSATQSILDSTTAFDALQHFHISGLLIIIYFAGFCVAALQFMIGLHKIYRLYKTADKHRFSGHTLLVIAEKINPFSFFRLLFVSQIHLDDEAYPIIRSHELKHIAEWHSFDILLVEILRIVFWFNPILGLYKKALSQSHEYIADKGVLSITKKKQYGHLLLGMNNKNLGINLANNFINSLIKNRIMMLYKSNSQALVSIRYLLIIPLTFILLFLFSCNNDAPIEVIENVQLIGEEKSNLNGDVYTVVEEMPRFPGCETEGKSMEEKENCARTKLLQFLYSNLKYPQSAREKGVEGTVVVKFVITETGKISNIQIVIDIGEGCGEAVIQVVGSMNEMDDAWIPGKQRGEVVKVQYMLPVKFKLE